MNKMHESALEHVPNLGPQQFLALPPVEMELQLAIAEAIYALNAVKETHLSLLMGYKVAPPCHRLVYNHSPLTL